MVCGGAGMWWSFYIVVVVYIYVLVACGGDHCNLERDGKSILILTG